MSEHINLSAYDNVENLKNFSEEEFQQYCDDKIKTCEKHLCFIKKLALSKNFDICEIGSGNSKLLYALEQNNMINSGVGIEISKSRFLFAEKFKEYINSTKVQNLNENIFNIHTPISRLSDILTKIGFRDITIQDYWYNQGDCEEDEFIIIAKK